MVPFGGEDLGRNECVSPVLGIVLRCVLDI